MQIWWPKYERNKNELRSRERKDLEIGEKSNEPNEYNSIMLTNETIFYLY